MNWHALGDKIVGLAIKAIMVGGGAYLGAVIAHHH